MAHLYTGRDGYMMVGNAKVAKVTSFSLQGDLELLDVTSLEDSVKRFVPGLQSFSGTASIMYYRESANGTQTTASLLDSFFSRGGSGVVDPVRLSFRFADKDGQGLKNITVEAFITSMSLGASVGEVSSAQISFTARDTLSDVSL